MDNNNGMDIRRKILEFNEQLLNQINSTDLAYKEGFAESFTEGFAESFAEGEIEGEIIGRGEVLKSMGRSKEETKQILKKKGYDPEKVNSIVEEQFDEWKIMDLDFS